MSTVEQQRAAALDAANQVRVDRAKLRLKIAAGDIQAHHALELMPQCLNGCGVYIFLTYVRGVGKSRVNKPSKAFALLRKANVPGHKRLDQITPAQLERLTRVVREYEQSRHPAERGLA